MEACGQAVARVPAWAVGLSLALHGAFLAAPALHSVRQAIPPVPLLATLRLPAPAPESLKLPAARAVVSNTVLPSPMVARAHTEPAPVPIAAAEPAPQAMPVPAPVPSPIEQAAAPEPAPPPAMRAEARAAPAPEPPDATGLANYARLLAELLARQQQYPRLAALRGWQGEVQLRVQIARKGSIVAVQILQSSGFEVLDRHALQMLQQAAPLPRLPEALQEREFHIVVPIHYKLEKTT